MRETLKRLNQLLFFVLVLTLGITFFARNRLQGIQEIRPEILNQPIQGEVTSPDVIRFSRNDYDYGLTPVKTYDISALIVSKIDYGAFTIYKIDKTFHLDFCLLWGQNAANRVFQEKGVSFFQDCRWCWVRWTDSVGFNLNELSNHHLLVRDPLLEKKVKSFHVGDQIRLRGKLVNVKAKLVGKAGQYDAKEASWNTSVSRNDSGAGACEIIYVEEAELLKAANVRTHLLFRISLYGLLLWISGNVLSFFWNIFVLLRPPENPV